MEFSSFRVDISQWIEFIWFGEIFLVKLNAWNSCPEHVITIERISVNGYRLSDSVHYTSICNNRRIAKWFEYKSHHQGTVGERLQLKILFWKQNVTHVLWRQPCAEKLSLFVDSAFFITFRDKIRVYHENRKKRVIIDILSLLGHYVGDA